MRDAQKGGLDRHMIELGRRLSMTVHSLSDLEILHDDIRSVVDE